MAPNHSPRFLQIVQDAKKRIREVTVDDVKAKLDHGEKFLLVDVREESEYAKDHLPGAIHLGKGVIERDVEQKIPNADSEIVLYCGGGLRPPPAGCNLPQIWLTHAISPVRGIRHQRAQS